jgi:hypothetical protein
MDPIPFTLASGIGSVLLATIAYLVKLLLGQRTSSDAAREEESKRCTERVDALESKVDKLYKTVAENTALELRKAEQREEREIARSAQLTETIARNSRAIADGTAMIQTTGLVVQHAMTKMAEYRKTKSSAELPAPPTDDQSTSFLGGGGG